MTQPQPQAQKPPEPIQEEALDAMISLVEGPLNTAGEKLFSSNLVLAPMALAMNVSLRMYGVLLGKTNWKGGAK